MAQGEQVDGKTFTLIDVREKDEFKDGTIPKAYNVPTSLGPAIWTNADEDTDGMFEDTFGFEKPERNSPLLFYCKAGVRSAMMAKYVANQLGYTDVWEYPGSYMEWVEKSKEKV
ncbi:hypothetical protein BZG36_01071 [Bifiguratus adelaidae]|uniref:Rhodanese domain-containing protein n=1 Tax=Bifiguratus adelaidae TaxID=1938954 RepID=A0A261Y5W1_9FUNG|nr:hypothetical protein BZG36_01071 [Bifiguratus adelaidae]